MATEIPQEIVGFGECRNDDESGSFNLLTHAFNTLADEASFRRQSDHYCIHMTKEFKILFKFYNMHCIASILESELNFLTNCSVLS